MEPPRQEQPGVVSTTTIGWIAANGCRSSVQLESIACFAEGGERLQPWTHRAVVLVRVFRRLVERRIERSRRDRAIKQDASVLRQGRKHLLAQQQSNSASLIPGNPRAVISSCKPAKRCSSKSPARRRISTVGRQFQKLTKTIRSSSSRSVRIKPTSECPTSHSQPA